MHLSSRFLEEMATWVRGSQSTSLAKYLFQVALSITIIEKSWDSLKSSKKIDYGDAVHKQNVQP